MIDSTSKTSFAYTDFASMNHEYVAIDSEVVVVFDPSDPSILQTLEGEVQKGGQIKDNGLILGPTTRCVNVPAIDYGYGFALFGIDPSKRKDAFELLDKLRKDGKLDYMPAFVDKAKDEGKIKLHAGPTYFLPSRAAIRFDESADENKIEEFLQQNNFIVVKKYEHLGVYFVKFPFNSSESPVDVLFGNINSFSGNNSIKSFDGVRASFYIQAMTPWPTDVNADPADPDYTYQWGFETTSQSYSARIDGAWTFTTSGVPGSDKVVIAFVDTGLDTSHADLFPSGSTRLFEPYNTKDNNTNVTDSDGHGTNVASVAIAIANNNKGIAGIAPGCKVMPLKAASSLAAAVNLDLAEAIQRVADAADSHKNDPLRFVLNLSWRIYSSDPDIATAILDGTYGAYKRNVVIVCAAGDDDYKLENDPVWPAIYSYDATQHVIAVAAHKQTGGRKSLSNYSDSTGMVISAPGDSIRTYDPGNSNSVTRAGSSFAAAFVSGVAALMWSKDISDGTFDKYKSGIISLIMNNTFGSPAFAKGRLHGRDSVAGV